MGVFNRLFGGNSKGDAGGENQQRSDEHAISPIFPALPDKEPLKFYKVADYLVMLVVNSPPAIDKKFGSRVIPVSMIAINPNRQSMCAITAQTVFPSRPPYLVVWQLDGRYRIHNTTFTEPIDTETFFRTYFMELITELHLSGNIEIVEMVPKKI